jgi:type VI secretion system protein VasD
MYKPTSFQKEPETEPLAARRDRGQSVSTDGCQAGASAEDQPRIHAARFAHRLPERKSWTSTLRTRSEWLADGYCARSPFPGKLRGRIGLGMGIRRSKFADLVILGMAVAGSGSLPACAHSAPPAAAPAPCPSPEPLRVSLRASPHLNPTEKGDALATVVRVYQLKGTGRIAVASFDDLLDHDRDTLGEDFVAVQEVTLNPAAALDPPLVRSPDATYVAVVALFRKPAGTAWRTVEKLPSPDAQYCHRAPADANGSPANDSNLRFEVYDNQVAPAKAR